MSLASPRRLLPLAPLPVALLPLLLAGCVSRPLTPDRPPPPFVFRSLNLRQQDPLGRPSWELTAPEARYDLRRRVAQALEPKGMIFRGGKPLYRVQASSGVVLNDGEVIQLEGDIRVERLGDRPLLIRGSRARWFPASRIMMIDRHPEALDGSNRLAAIHARFLIYKDQLELRGTPVLQHWQRRFDPLRETPRGTPDVELSTDRADWEPGTGQLDGGGPIRALRRPPGATPGQSPQVLTASALSGNTIRQRYTLGAPVLFRDPIANDNLSARKVEVVLGSPLPDVSTAEPFSGNRGLLQVRGNAMAMAGAQTTLTIPDGCQLEQPSESLRAARCSWNWETQAVTADGRIELRRETNRQLTRGAVLRGRLGKEGQLTISNPGGRVFSQFQVPRRSGPPAPTPRRETPQPIRL